MNGEKIRHQEPMEERVQETSLAALAPKVAELLEGHHTTVELSILVEKFRETFPDCFPSGYDSHNPDQRTEARNKIVKRIFEMMRGIHPIIILRQAAGGEFEGCEGEMNTGEYYAVQIDDPKGLFKGEDAPLQGLGGALSGVLENIRFQLNLFKAHIIVEKDKIRIYMDPGSHKEFVGVALPDQAGGKTLLAYQHVLSAHERRGSEKTHRVEYVQKVLRNIGIFPYMQEDRYIFGLASSLSPQSDFAELLRLSVSVKDLDISLRQEDVDFAVRLFQKGVTNMHNFLAHRNNMRKGRMLKGDEIRAQAFDSHLNPREQELIGQYRDFLKQAESARQMYKERIEDLQRAKNLNYEIIALLLGLQEKGRKVIAGEDVLRARSYNLDRQFGIAIRKLRQMEKCVAKVNPFSQELRLRSRIDEIAEEFAPHVEAMDILAKGGETLSNTNAIARNFNAIFEDRGGEFNRWDDVKSLEEAVRYLHGLLYSARKLDVEPKQQWYTHELSDMFESVSGVPVLDVCDRGIENSDLYKLFRKTVKRCPAFTVQQMLGDGDKYKMPFLIFGDDYAEMSFPQGKHKIEIAAQASVGENQEYGISLRYYEPGYHGSSLRLDYIQEVLTSLGFRFARIPEGNRGMLLSAIYTQDKSKWETVFSETTRLVYSLTNLDLVPGLTQHAARWFKKGVTDMHIAGAVLRCLEQDDAPLSEVQEGIERIFRRKYGGGFGERKYAAELIIGRAKNVQEIRQMLTKLDENELDRVIGSVYDLADEAKEGGDKKAQRKFNRVGSHLLEFFDERFPHGTAKK